MDTTQIQVDVYGWVEAAEKEGRVPMSGIFRHLYALAKSYTPAIALPAHQNAPQKGLELINRYLHDRPIRILRPGTIEGVWVSASVDHLCADILADINAYRVALLHDVPSELGISAFDNENRYLEGMILNEAFLSVSNTTMWKFRATARNHHEPFKPIIQYGCPHNYSILPELVYSAANSQRSLSIHKCFTYKNFFDSLRLASVYKTQHTHIGAASDQQPADYFKLLKEYYSFKQQNSCGDQELIYLYGNAKMFFCMSREEGFSMPPMEAILAGVPYVFVSDIPIHREIYGGLGVNFIPLDFAEHDLPKTLVQTTVNDRRRLFERYSFENLIQPFEDFVRRL